MKSFLFVLALVSSTVYANVVDELIAARRLELADAYWLAGQRYIELNKEDLGRQMQARARQLVPGYVPPAQRPPNEGVPALAPVPIAVLVPEIDPEALTRRTAQGARIVRLQFTKMMRGFLSEDIDTLVSVFGAEVRGSSFEGEITRAEVRRRIAEVFATHEADKLTPEMLVDMASIRVTFVEGTEDDFSLSVNTVPEAPEFLTSRPWWGPVLNFYFVREKNLWLVEGIF